MRKSVTEEKVDVVVRHLARSYLHSLWVLIALLPLMAIGYLAFQQDSSLRFKALGLYEISSLMVISLGAFITYVTWRCYLASGEVFLRWLTLAFLSFTLIYLPHALISQISDDMMSVFIAYGPTSRLAMGICFLVALARLGVPPDSPNSRRRSATWQVALCIIISIDIGLAALILNPLVQTENMIKALETVSLLLLLISIMVIILRRIRLSLMIVYMLSISFFAQASVAFMISDLWSHLWWLAHAIFLTGFFLLSYGVVHAFNTTRSFSAVHSQAEGTQKLRDQQVQTPKASVKIETTNVQPNQQATTDWLTGVANRRHFMRQADGELARAKRNGTQLSLLCLDLDHFQLVNDTHGRQAGDQVLKHVATKIAENLNPPEFLARIGSEEFIILLPGVDIQQACEIAERCRSAIHDTHIQLQEKVVKVTISIGCAQMDQDGTSLDSLMRAGDQRLYEAKTEGCNQVFSKVTVGRD